jgi:hypothetical protein
MNEMKRPLLALLAAAWPWAVPLMSGATGATGAPAMKYCTSLTKDHLAPSNAPAGSDTVLSYWHPMEIELVFDANLYHADPADTAYFTTKPPAGGAPAGTIFQVDFPAADAAAAKTPADTAPAVALAAGIRPRVQRDAAAAKGAAVKSTTLNAFSDTELHFLECRMKLTGNADAFQAQRAAGHANPDALGKFVIYWRAFMASELQQYVSDSAKLAAGAPVDSKGLYATVSLRTADAVADVDPAKNPDKRAAMFANAGMTDFAATTPGQPSSNACSKLPPTQTPDSLSQDECNLLSNDQQKQYVTDMVGAADLPGRQGVVTKYRAIASAIKTPFPDTGTAATLSATEAKYMSDADQKDYLAKLAKAPSNPKWKHGDKDDGSKEALTDANRFALNNLGTDELNSLGTSSTTMKAQIDATAIGSDARMKIVQNDRQVSSAILHHNSILPQQFKNAQDLAQYLADNPNNRECVWTGNCNTSSVTGPGGVGTGGTGPAGVGITAPGTGTGSTAPDQPNITDTSAAPPMPDQAEGKKTNDGMANLKKDLPAIGNGIRMGIWAAILGFFIAGPAGVALFAACGFAAGFGISKVNTFIGS